MRLVIDYDINSRDKTNIVSARAAIYIHDDGYIADIYKEIEKFKKYEGVKINLVQIMIGDEK